MVDIYTDGACDPNPGFGGWGFVIPSIGIDRCGGESNTTNNRMEMRAIVEALRYEVEGDVVILSDSTYAINVIGGRWKGKVNKDLISEARALMKGRRIGFKWVKGHSGNRWNEHADKLASIGRKKHMGDRRAPAAPKPAVSLDGVDWRQW